MLYLTDVGPPVIEESEGGPIPVFQWHSLVPFLTNTQTQTDPGPQAPATPANQEAEASQPEGQSCCLLAF